MNYENIKKAIFINRPNRFVANIEIDGKPETCHVKNTGRCHELLTRGAQILVQECYEESRKTKYDLISVWKGDVLINMDSSAPNKVFGQWLENGGYFKNVSQIKPEQRFGTSRLDFYFEANGKATYAEVKGVTLEQDGVARFPDAPTERGLKHVHELMKCAAAGFDAYIIFVVQMKGIRHFEPNVEMQAAFGEALRKAEAAGVKIIALDCIVTETTIVADKFVEVKL